MTAMTMATKKQGHNHNARNRRPPIAELVGPTPVDDVCIPTDSSRALAAMQNYFRKIASRESTGDCVLNSLMSFSLSSTRRYLRKIGKGCQTESRSHQSSRETETTNGVL
jgi:hypothetical protein